MVNLSIYLSEIYFYHLINIVSAFKETTDYTFLILSIMKATPEPINVHKDIDYLT